MAVEKSTPCYICWFLTISLAIPAGILLSDAIKAGITHLFFDKNSTSITQESDRADSDESKTSQPPKTESSDQELPTVKLSPKEEGSDKDIFIKVLPDKKTPKEKKSGYQTTLEICEYWKEEYKKEATRKNATYMEAACNRLKSYE